MVAAKNPIPDLLLKDKKENWYFTGIPQVGVDPEGGFGGGAEVQIFDNGPADSPLFHMPNVVVTPHAAGVDLRSRDDMALSAAQAIVSLSKGEWPAEKIVNPEVKAKYHW